MKPKILLLSNSMLFHFSFCSLYKTQFDIDSLLLRYLNRNLNSEIEHFYIQIKEQKRKKLFTSGTLGEPNRIILTSKSIQNVIKKCLENKYEKIVIEMSSGTREELLLLKHLNQTNIPVSVFVSSIEDQFINELHNLEVHSLFQLTDLFNLKVRL